MFERITRFSLNSVHLVSLIAQQNSTKSRTTQRKCTQADHPYCTKKKLLVFLFLIWIHKVLLILENIVECQSLGIQLQGIQIINDIGLEDVFVTHFLQQLDKFLSIDEAVLVRIDIVENELEIILLEKENIKIRCFYSLLPNWTYLFGRQLNHRFLFLNWIKEWSKRLLWDK